MQILTDEQMNRFNICNEESKIHKYWTTYQKPVL